jgi:hypothetical protein
MAKKAVAKETVAAPRLKSSALLDISTNKKAARLIQFGQTFHRLTRRPKSGLAIRRKSHWLYLTALPEALQNADWQSCVLEKEARREQGPGPPGESCFAQRWLARHSHLGTRPRKEWRGVRSEDPGRHFCTRISLTLLIVGCKRCCFPEFVNWQRCLGCCICTMGDLITSLKYRSRWL